MGRDRADDSLKSERMVALSQATKPVAYVYNLPFVCLCVCVCVCWEKREIGRLEEVPVAVRTNVAQILIWNEKLSGRQNDLSPCQRNRAIKQGIIQLSLDTRWQAQFGIASTDSKVFGTQGKAYLRSAQRRTEFYLGRWQIANVIALFISVCTVQTPLTKPPSSLERSTQSLVCEGETKDGGMKLPWFSSSLPLQSSGVFQMRWCNLCWHVSAVRWETWNNKRRSSECDRPTDRGRRGALAERDLNICRLHGSITNEAAADAFNNTGISCVFGWCGIQNRRSQDCLSCMLILCIYSDGLAVLIRQPGQDVLTVARQISPPVVTSRWTRMGHNRDNCHQINT